jgi:hypothetical protein
MTSTPLLRWTGLAAMLGGILAMGVFVALASRPPGVPNLSYRDTTGLGPFTAAALLLLTVGLTGLHARYTVYTGKLGLVGIILGGGSLAALLIGFGLVTVRPNSSLIPLAIIPGMIALVAGSLCSGVALWRAGILPRPAIGLLICGFLALLLYNSEDARAWFGLPFGFAWLVLGYIVWSDKVGGRSVGTRCEPAR